MSAGRTFGILLTAAVLCAAGSPAQALVSSETSTGTNFLETLVDRTASGWKVYGTIDVVYAGLELESPCTLPGMEGDFEVTMIVSLGMRKDGTAFPFSTTATTCLFDAEGQVGIISDYITGTVMPTLFPGLAGPRWKLKDIRNVATPRPEIPYSVEFVMAEIELAVQPPFGY